MGAKKNPRTKTAWIGAGLIFFLAVLAYGLLIPKMGFYGDEWYLAYAGRVEGAAKFVDIFASDRPFRAPLVGIMFQLFGLNATAHGFTSLALKIIGAWGVFWLFDQLFPRQRWISISMAALFAVYPGFMMQPVGFDYQSHHVALVLEIYSIAMMVAAWRNPKVWISVTLLVVGTIFSFLSFLLMEWFIGLEALRFAILLYLASDGGHIKVLLEKPRRRLKKMLLFWLPFALASLAFLYWRVIIFHSTRSQTDIPGLVESFRSSFVLSSISIITDLVRNYLNLVFAAWVVPFYDRFNPLRLRDMLLAGSIGIVALILVYLVWKGVFRKDESNNPAINADNEAANPAWLFWLGSIGVIATLIPVIFGQREVNFSMYSRFTYPGSIGAVLIVGAVLLLIRNNAGRAILISLLVGISVTANVANAMHFVRVWDSMRDFWWQVSWRIPQIKPESMIVANYQYAPVAEDFYVWGPASLVFFPESYKPEGFTRSPIGSVVLTNDNINAIQMGRELGDRSRRGILLNQDLRNPLLISTPKDGSCAQVINGKALELSRFENQAFQLIAKYSSLDRIDLSGKGRTPPADIFGQEPPHEWCYYFEKASLARQQGDWSEAARLGEMAARNGYRPLDRVEWFPFLQAYAYTGNYERVDEIIRILMEEPYLRVQGCAVFSNEDPALDATQAAGRAYLREVLCK